MPITKTWDFEKQDLIHSGSGSIGKTEGLSAFSGNEKAHFDPSYLQGLVLKPSVGRKGKFQRGMESPVAEGTGKENRSSPSFSHGGKRKRELVLRRIRDSSCLEDWGGDYPRGIHPLPVF